MCLSVLCVVLSVSLRSAVSCHVVCSLVSPVHVKSVVFVASPKFQKTLGVATYVAALPYSMRVRTYVLYSLIRVIPNEGTDP